MQNVIIIINVYLLCSCRQMSERFPSKKLVIKKQTFFIHFHRNDNVVEYMYAYYVY